MNYFEIQIQDKCLKNNQVEMDLFELSAVQNKLYRRQPKLHNIHDICAKLTYAELILGKEHKPHLEQ